MIICSHCGDAHCLEIVRSKTAFSEDGRDFEYLLEVYECQIHKTRGTYEFGDDIETVAGDIEKTDDRPLTILESKQRGVL